MNGNVLEITPPLTITERDIDDASGLLDRAFDEFPLVSDATVSRFAGW